MIYFYCIYLSVYLSIYLAIYLSFYLSIYLSTHPSINRFVIVPGSQDPGMARVLPRRPIPDIYREQLQSKVTHIAFASNPCRLRYYTQEIVIFRENLIRKMQRFSLQPLLSNSLVEGGSEEGQEEVDVTYKLAYSIADQVYILNLICYF